MKIAAFSDSHGNLTDGLLMENGKWVELPKIDDDADVVCIAGDIIPLNIQRNVNESEYWFTNFFFEWAKELKVKKIFLVAGNHDFAFEKWGKEYVDELIKKHNLEDKLIYLCDTLYEYEGVKFFGSPWIKDLYNWAFYSPDLVKTFTCIPDCDVLITHIPPKYDKVGCSYPNQPMERNFGSEALTDVLSLKKITYNICGHIHTGVHNGVPFIHKVDDGKDWLTTIYNVSLLNESYYEVYPVTYMDI